MSGPNDPPVSVLLTPASQALGLSQEDLGNLLGVSRRTISRWVSDGTVLTADQLSTLARAVYPANASLAMKIAATGGTTLEGLGIVQPPKAIEPPPPSRLVDVVVCAAAEALDASPRTVRRAVVAAFEAARDVGLDVEGVVRGLGQQAHAKRPAERVAPKENAPGTQCR